MKMKCFKLCVILTLFYVHTVMANYSDIKNHMKSLTDQIEILKTQHQVDIIELKKQIDELKLRSIPTDNHERNEQVTLQWARSSMHEIRVEMKELDARLNNSVLLRQIHVFRNELKQALMETSDLAKLARTQETRIDKLDAEVSRLKYEAQQMRTTMAELRVHINKLSKDVKYNQVDEMNNALNNNIVGSSKTHIRELKYEYSNHKYRHNRMVHIQISRLAHTQNQIEKFQQNLQTQILDVQRRLDRFEEPNWNLLTTKVDFLEIETKAMQDVLKNTTQKVSDLDKVHASILELREDLENVENKADKTIPEFRKEISKLDISYAQLNAQFSYIKENQENLRQSVKAIAVSVSNTIDRAELDRITMKKINDTICELDQRSKRHFYRLNDHILKSEANVIVDNSTIISLPQLMGEVKELQPVQHEYEDLVKQLPKDCSSVPGPPNSYLIRPAHVPVETWCVNGSTLIQRRYNGSIEFNRKFYEYVNGFGDPASEYWLGLESMHLLTADNCSSMRIDMTDIYDGAWYAQYDDFYVGSADSGYVLEVGGFTGNASDAFAYQNHMEFSAVDHDRDISNTHCAGNYEGGWWYSHCQHVNINGKYTLGLTWFDSIKNEWIAVATSEMRMYRKPDCS